MKDVGLKVLFSVYVLLVTVSLIGGLLSWAARAGAFS